MQAKLVEVAVGPFLERCNALCAPILKAPLAFKDGELGMTEREGFHGWKTFSGTERTMAFAAVSIACAEDQAFRLVCLDEFDIDQTNLPKLAELLCTLQSSGIIDQALVAHTVCPRFISANFANIELKS